VSGNEETAKKIQDAYQEAIKKKKTDKVARTGGDLSLN
jgi:hypothetical protein